MAPCSRSDGVLMFFHRGGYCSGSILSHRRVVIKTGWAGMRADVGLSISARTPVLRRIARCADGSRACFAHGVAARRIALAGDSAAGGLTVALLNLLKERRDRGADALEIWPHMLDVWPVPPAVANEWVKPPPAPQERSDVQRFGYGVSAHHSAR
jgi:acetyl esterase/lipase